MSKIKKIYLLGGNYKTGSIFMPKRRDIVSIEYIHRFSTFRLTKINKRKYEDIYK
jgi:hypothetical protein